MKNLLYVIAAILVIGWILGLVVYAVGVLIHVLVVLAIAVVVWNFIRGKKTS